jgi:hypothetical protein
MPSIFVSHSRHDEDIRTFFDKAFAGAAVKAIRLEFEEFAVSPSIYVMEQVRLADAVFHSFGPKYYP